MSIQWTLIAGYLYFEVGIVIVLMLPIASPRKWNQLFRSQLFARFRERSAIYFYVLLGVLALFLVDAIREIGKYSHSSDSGHIHVATEMKGSVKLFRAQRNFYITGFAIFLAFVIRRLVTMIITQAEIIEKSAAIIKEAEVAKDLIKNSLIAESIQFTENSEKYNEMQSQLEAAEQMLQNEKNRNRTLETEINLWKLKFEEISKKTGKGDQ